MSKRDDRLTHEICRLVRETIESAQIDDENGFILDTLQYRKNIINLFRTEQVAPNDYSAGGTA